MKKNSPKFVLETEKSNELLPDSVVDNHSMTTNLVTGDDLLISNFVSEDDVLIGSLLTDDELPLTNLEGEFSPTSLQFFADDTTSSLLDFLSSDDIFGPEIDSFQITSESLWFSALSENLFFDTDLVYSSHEVIHLKDQNLFYDDSPHDSLIFVGDGNSNLLIEDKQADIFLELGTETSIRGKNSSINLFTTLDETSEVTLEGEFSNLSLTVYSDEEIKIDDVRIVDNRLFFGKENGPSVDLSNITYTAETIEIKSYTDAGLNNSQSLLFSTRSDENGALAGLAEDSPLLEPDSSPGLDITDFLHPDDILLDGSSDRIFESDVEVINLHQNAAKVDISDEANALINKNTSDDDFDFVIEENISTLITEPEMLLETGQLFTDPLDVFDESDFS